MHWLHVWANIANEQELQAILISKELN